jgi:hypothetical protein
MFENFGKTLDRLVRDVSTETKATPIEVRTEPISATYPEGDAVQLRLELNVGTLELSAGTDNLVDGTATFNVAEWTPRVVAEGPCVTVKQDVGLHLFGAWHAMRNTWKLALGTSKPFALSVAKGAGEATMALGGIPLSSTDIEVGAGRAQVSFDKANPSRSSFTRVNLGAGSLFLDKVLNANTERLVFAGGAGELTVNFTGDSLQRPMTAKLDTGAGKLVLNFRNGLPCQVVVKKFLGTVHTQGTFHSVQPEVYETAAYSTATGPTLRIEIHTPIADIALNELS